MAKSEAPVAQPGQPPDKSGPLAFIVPMLVLTVIAGVGGGLFGMYGLGKGGKTDEQAKHGAASEKQGMPDTLSLTPLAAIVTNLASPKGTWIRLEASIVIEGGLGKEQSLLVGQISEDVVAFLRTMSLSQIEGANGFLHLREDLNDRARVRGGSKVRELVIQSLVVE